MFFRIHTLAILIVFSAFITSQQASAFQSVAPGESESMKMANMLKTSKVELKMQLEKYQATAADLEEKLDSLSGVTQDQVIAAESYPDVIKSLHSQRVQLMITVAGLEARRKAILAATEEIASKQIEKSVLEPLEKAVRIRFEICETTKKRFEQGEVPKSVLMQHQLALLQAESQLAEKKSKGSNSAMLDQFTQTLLDTSLELAERKAMLTETESLISKIVPAQKNLVALDKARKARMHNDIQLRRVEEQLGAIEKQIQVFLNQDKNSK